jgi:glutathionyl-hydroquinone reductase
MNAHRCRVDHLHLAVMGRDNGVHQTVPDAGLPPAVEAIVDRRIRSITVGNGQSAQPGPFCGGFATSQTAYEEAIAPLFETLDWLESRLASVRYLLATG